MIFYRKNIQGNNNKSLVANLKREAQVEGMFLLSKRISRNPSRLLK